MRTHRPRICVDNLKTIYDVGKRSTKFFNYVCMLNITVVCKLVVFSVQVCCREIDNIQYNSHCYVTP